AAGSALRHPQLRLAPGRRIQTRAASGAAYRAPGAAAVGVPGSEPTAGRGRARDAAHVSTCIQQQLILVGQPFQADVSQVTRKEVSLERLTYCPLTFLPRLHSFTHRWA